MSILPNSRDCVWCVNKLLWFPAGTSRPVKEDADSAKEVMTSASGIFQPDYSLIALSDVKYVKVSWLSREMTHANPPYADVFTGNNKREVVCF